MEGILRRGFAVLGISPHVDAFKRFEQYYDFLDERSKVMNLTAISGKTDTARLHFLDSAAMLGVTALGGKRVVDIGSGAGFPGLPVKILLPDMELTLLDSQKKRIDFLVDLCARLGLDDVTCLWARAEEAAETMRECFDVSMSRAVARLNILAELCLPLVRVGGCFLSMKSGARQEISEAESAVRKLGGELQNIYEYTIPGTEINREIIVIKKTSATPPEYPRRFSRIRKQPL